MCEVRNSMNRVDGPEPEPIVESSELSDMLVAEIKHLMVTDELLKTIYCLKEGTDTAHGLDSCDNYKQWLKDIIKQYETMRGY